MKKSDPTDADLIAEARRLLADERLWCGPWVARRFEIDCPCPNGEHCGDTHTCDEVSAPEAYPGDQCVVQISVPGLETFTKPTAEFIAASRELVPALCDLAERLQRERDQARAFNFHREQMENSKLRPAGEVARDVIRERSGPVTYQDVDVIRKRDAEVLRWAQARVGSLTGAARLDLLALADEVERGEHE